MSIMAFPDSFDFEGSCQVLNNEILSFLKLISKTTYQWTEKQCFK